MWVDSENVRGFGWGLVKVVLMADLVPMTDTWGHVGFYLVALAGMSKAPEVAAFLVFNLRSQRLLDGPWWTSQSRHHADI